MTEVGIDVVPKPVQGLHGLAEKQVYRDLKWTTNRNPVKSLMKLHFTKFGIAILFDSRSRLDLFKSPSEKKYELTIICQYECSKDQNWVVRIASLRLPILSGLRCALVSTYYR